MDPITSHARSITGTSHLISLRKSSQCPPVHGTCMAERFWMRVWVNSIGSSFGWSPVLDMFLLSLKYIFPEEDDATNHNHNNNNNKKNTNNNKKNKNNNKKNKKSKKNKNNNDHDHNHNHHNHPIYVLYMSGSLVGFTFVILCRSCLARLILGYHRRLTGGRTRRALLLANPRKAYPLFS